MGPEYGSVSCRDWKTVLGFWSHKICLMASVSAGNLSEVLKPWIQHSYAVEKGKQKYAIVLKITLPMGSLQNMELNRSWVSERMKAETFTLQGSLCTSPVQTLRSFCDTNHPGYITSAHSLHQTARSKPQTSRIITHCAKSKAGTQFNYESNLEVKFFSRNRPSKEILRWL